jgi:hypothetical protein
MSENLNKLEDINLYRWSVTSKTNSKWNKMFLCKYVIKGLPWEIVAWINSQRQVDGDIPSDLKIRLLSNYTDIGDYE